MRASHFGFHLQQLVKKSIKVEGGDQTPHSRSKPLQHSSKAKRAIVALTNIMGRSRRYRREEEESDTEDEDSRSYYYTLMPDTKSPFSCCCICYRYLLDACLILALSPFIVNCLIEAVIYLIKFDWRNITWGSAILAIFVVSLWLSVAVFGILCCVSVARKGVFTRRLRQRRKDDAEAERLSKLQGQLEESSTTDGSMV